MKKFIQIVFTPEKYLKGEEERISRLILDSEADFIHLRHPSLTISEIGRILDNLNPKVLKKVTIHDNFELIRDYPIGGVHLNSRNPVFPTNIEPDIRVSVSCHSIKEVMDYDDAGINLNYLTLSPIFDSISKKGYKSAFDLPELSRILPEISIPIVALGGVTPDTFPLLEKTGFAGAAMLGWYWGNI